MDAVQRVEETGGFTIVVPAAGWWKQRGFWIAAGILLWIAGWLSNAFWHGFPINDRPGRPEDTVWLIPVWIIALLLAAVALQRAYRKLVFVVGPESIVIASSGPLRRRIWEFPRRALMGAVVGDSNISVNEKPLRQLQLYFAERTTPLCLLTGRSEEDLARIAKYLVDGLDLRKNQFSSEQFMEVRESPIHANFFFLACAAGTVVGFAAVLLRGLIGNPACAILFFTDAFAVIVAVTVVTRTCQCPKCHATLKRDASSPQGHWRYTCPACRIVWQSPIRTGGSS